MEEQEGEEEEEEEEEGEEEKEEGVEEEEERVDSYTIFQCDGADTVTETSESEYSTEDEAYPVREAAVLGPAAAQPPAGHPLVLEVDETGSQELPASLPLVMLTNARSCYNKADSLKKMASGDIP